MRKKRHLDENEMRVKVYTDDNKNQRSGCSRQVCNLNTSKPKAGEFKFEASTKTKQNNKKPWFKVVTVAVPVNSHSSITTCGLKYWDTDIHITPFNFFFLLFEAGFHVVQDNLEFNMYLTMNFWSSCLHQSSTQISDMYHHAQFIDARDLNQGFLHGR